MKVSIIIPVYNLAEYAGNAIESCLRQDHSDIEVIVVNDGSTDRSDEVISKYLGDSRIIYITQAHAGVSEARNAGVRMATGDYLTFLDADDYLSGDALSANIRLIERQKRRPAWVLFPLIRLDASGNQIDNAEDDPLANCQYTKDEIIDSQELYQRYEQGTVAPCVCASLYARDFFDVDFPRGRFESAYVFLMLVRKQPYVLMSSRGLYCCRDRGDQSGARDFDANKLLDYTRVNILKYKTGMELMPAARAKYQYQASASYYNLVYLKNKYHNNPEYGKSLDYFIKEYGPVEKDWALSMKCTVKSILCRVLMR